MTDDGSAQPSEVCPLPKFRFQVKLDTYVMSFEEATGLDIQPTEIEYRQSDSQVFPPKKMPGLKKFGTVTMKKGVVMADNQFCLWLDQIKTNAIKRVPITISLLDEAGAPKMIWTLTNAWPTKATGTNMNGSKATIETLEITHEGLTIGHN